MFFSSRLSNAKALLSYVQLSNDMHYRYLATLYSHKKWPNVRPDIIHKDIKKRVKDNLLNKLLAALQIPGTLLSNIMLTVLNAVSPILGISKEFLSDLISEFEPVNITQMFGLSLASNLIPDVRIIWTPSMHIMLSVFISVLVMSGYNDYFVFSKRVGVVYRYTAIVIVYWYTIR